MLWWGFAHRFRPTYAGANIGHPCGAVTTEGPKAVFIVARDDAWLHLCLRVL
jgi:hypothetical protein